MGSSPAVLAVGSQIWQTRGDKGRPVPLSTRVQGSSQPLPDLPVHHSWKQGVYFGNGITGKNCCINSM